MGAHATPAVGLMQAERKFQYTLLAATRQLRAMHQYRLCLVTLLQSLGHRARIW